MIPLPHYTAVGGIPVTELIGMETSAWYALGHVAATMATAVIRDQKHLMPCCVKLNGQYELKIY